MSLLLLRVYLHHTMVKLPIANSAEFVALGVKLSAIFMSELSIYTASICAGVRDTQELCCFALWWECSLLVTVFSDLLWLLFCWQTLHGMQAFASLSCFLEITSVA